MLNTIKPTSNNVQFSLVCFFTRDWTVERWLEDLTRLEFPRILTELVFIVDVDNDVLLEKLTSYCRFYQDKFDGVKIYKSDQKFVNTLGVTVRRDRICYMHEISKELLGDSRYVFGLEDDTLFEADTFNKLVRHITDPNVGYVTGVQVGRWNIKHIGAWRVNDLFNPTHIETVSDKDEGIEMIDGGGFFCYLTPTSLYKEMKYHWHDDCFGPDVSYGIDVRKAGYICLLDYSIQTGHFTEQGVLYANENVVVAEWDLKDYGWAMKRIHWEKK